MSIPLPVYTFDNDSVNLCKLILGLACRPKVWYAQSQKMKRIAKLFIILIFSQLIFIHSIYASEMKNRSEYLVDVRGDDGDLCLNRLSVHKRLDSPDMQISGFLEAQWNFETDEWEKLLFGIEAGARPWEYLYIGQSVQVISGEMLDYMAFDANGNSTDTTTKISLGLPLSKDFSLRVFEEYSINIEKGRDEYIEIGSEVIYSIKDSCSIGIGWRHTDRIHNFDTDYVSSSLTLRF